MPPILTALASSIGPAVVRQIFDRIGVSDSSSESVKPTKTLRKVNAQTWSGAAMIAALGLSPGAVELVMAFHEMFVSLTGASTKQAAILMLVPSMGAFIGIQHLVGWLVPEPRSSLEEKR